MRFLHTSDWHLGRSFFGVSLLEDQAHTLDSLVAVVKEAAVDAERNGLREPEAGTDASSRVQAGTIASGRAQAGGDASSRAQAGTVASGRPCGQATP